MNRVVSDKEALCFKNEKPHWTVLYRVKKKWKKTLRHLLELRPKKNNAAQSKDGNEWWGFGTCWFAGFPTDWPHTFIEELCNESGMAPDSPRGQLQGIISDLNQVIPKAYWTGRLSWPAIREGCGGEASKIPLWWWFSNRYHGDSPTPGAAAQQSSGVSL